jgi:hypothetical protein
MGNSLSFKNDFMLIIVGAIIFTASFLWKDLLSDIQNAYLPKHNNLLYRFIFTSIVTILLVALAVYLRDVIVGPAVASESPLDFDDSPIENDIE